MTHTAPRSAPRGAGDGSRCPECWLELPLRTILVASPSSVEMLARSLVAWIGATGFWGAITATMSLDGHR